VFAGPARTGGVPRRVGSYIRIRVALYMWFCDHSEWWSVWLWVDAAPPWEVGFGLVGGWDFHIRVCMSNPVG
jgi:hypothetical protein